MSGFFTPEPRLHDWSMKSCDWPVGTLPVPACVVLLAGCSLDAHFLCLRILSHSTPCEPSRAPMASPPIPVKTGGLYNACSSIKTIPKSPSLLSSLPPPTPPSLFLGWETGFHFYSYFKMRSGIKTNSGVRFFHQTSFSFKAHTDKWQ